MNTKIKYKKKVLVTDEKSTPSARAARLKRLRNLANLTRSEMCGTGEININTLKGWEIGRYGGLPLDGAQKVITRIAKEGVTSTIDWLLYETGMGPVISDITSKNHQESDTKQTESIEDEDVLIQAELLYFKQFYKDTIDYAVKDDGMAPQYQVGDTVAGIKHYGTSIDSLIGMDCIVQLNDGRVLLRQIKKDPSTVFFRWACSSTSV